MNLNICFVLCFFLILLFSPSASCSGGCFSSTSAPLEIWRTFPPGSQNSCAPGFYCPNLNPNDNSTWAVVCPPSQDCAYLRLDSEYCPPQGTFEPALCQEGFYCPNFKQAIECPENYFCPPGSSQPRSCSLLSSCPKGSGKEQYYGSLLYIILFDVGLALLISAYRRREVNKLRAAQVSSIAKVGQSQGLLGSRLSDSFASAQPKELDRLEFEFDNLSLFLPFSQAEQDQIDKKKQRKLDQKEKEQDGLNAPAEQDAAAAAGADNSLRRGRAVISGVSGRFRPGRVCAILGASGAGKSTLLNLLLGKVPVSWTSSGALKVNGSPVLSSSLGSGSPLSRLLGFVPQEDILRTELTVWENIEYAASIRLPTSWSRDQIQQHVEAVVQALGIDHIRNQRIGDEFERGISGGERKRVSIAVELAGAPMALLLDEPSTGLSSKNSMDLFSLLSSIARSVGVSVAMVVHQPRIEAFDLFDDLLLLAKGGLTVYEGPRDRVFQYFEENFKVQLQTLEEENPADKIIDEIAKRGPQMHKFWNEKGRKQVHGSGDQPDPEQSRLEAAAGQDQQFTQNLKSASAARGASFLSQMLSSFVRSLRTQHALFGSLVLELLIASFAGLIMGLAARLPYKGVLVGPYALVSPVPDEQALPRASMLLCMGCSMAAAFSGVNVFYGVTGEQVVRWREARAGHRQLPYYLGVVLAQAFRNLIGAIHFSTLHHLISAPFIAYSDLLSIVLLLYFGWYGWATCISSLTSRENSSLVSVVGALIFSALNGYVNAVPQFVLYLSHCFWAGEAFFTRQSEPFLSVMQVQEISAEIFQYETGRYEMDLGILFLVAVAYHGIGFLLLRRRNKQH